MTSYRPAPATLSATPDQKFKFVPVQPTPLVSIVIPNFNHARYLGAAISSVLTQSYPNIEIIVVDDGSTDESRAVAARYGNRIRYIWQENRGLSAARNTGIRAASGEYIGLLDADDLYEPHCLATMMAILQANPEADGLYCGYQFVDQQNQLLPQIEARLIPTDQLYDTLLDGNFFVPESVLVHQRCYASAGAFDETLRACEDWDMWLRITRQHVIIGTDAVLTRHRVLAGSMSSDPMRMINNRLAVLKKHIIIAPDAPAEIVRRANKAYSGAYLISAVEYLQAGDEVRASNCLQQAAQRYPALLLQLPTFFELICGNQPKGQRGNFATLDLAANTQVLTRLLDQLFLALDDTTVTALELRQSKHEIYALADFALGLLSYGARQFAPARRYLWRALCNDPKLRSNQQLISTLTRTCLNPRFVEWVSQYRRRKV
ncbi:MAG: glycosyltransferase [Chloroflexi bacterium]|nr:glycosyltransferase [Chloroflexota bacterium]